jgi:hypothetical protein
VKPLRSRTSARSFAEIGRLNWTADFSGGAFAVSYDLIREQMKASAFQVRDAAGIGVSEWARRVRELREDENWPILTHNDSAGGLLSKAPNTSRCTSSQ